jgi:hypothetical protein
MTYFHIRGTGSDWRKKVVYGKTSNSIILNDTEITVDEIRKHGYKILGILEKDFINIFDIIGITRHGTSDDPDDTIEPYLVTKKDGSKLVARSASTAYIGNFNVVEVYACDVYFFYNGWNFATDYTARDFIKSELWYLDKIKNSINEKDELIAKYTNIFKKKPEKY